MTELKKQIHESNSESNFALETGSSPQSPVVTTTPSQPHYHSSPSEQQTQQTQQATSPRVHCEPTKQATPHSPHCATLPSIPFHSAPLLERAMPLSLSLPFPSEPALPSVGITLLARLLGSLASLQPHGLPCPSPSACPPFYFTVLCFPSPPLALPSASGGVQSATAAPAGFIIASAFGGERRILQIPSTGHGWRSSWIPGGRGVIAARLAGQLAEGAARPPGMRLTHRPQPL